jgi:hypothetical protein
MRPIGQFRHLMSSTILVAPRVGVDVTGKPTFGADVAYVAHLRGERRMVRNPDGQEVNAKLSAYLGQLADIQPTARVTLSTGDVGSTEEHARMPLLLAVDRVYDAAGPHHVVLRLG